MTQFVLVTAAYNEVRYIEPLLQSVAAQSIRPLRWVIVSDGSTDGTDAIVSAWTERYPFICLDRITYEHPRNFTAQVHAINHGLSLVRDLNYDFVGNLDADITLPPDYFQQLLDHFASNPSLGLAGGRIYERNASGTFVPRGMFTRTSVAHACQFFRRSVFEMIGGGYPPLPYGGPDTYAEISVRRRGFQVASLEQIPVFHHRPTNGAEGSLRGCFRQGKLDFSLGNLPTFEAVKLLRRVGQRPYVLGALVRLCGFLDSYFRRERRAVPPDFITYLRHEQRRKLTCSFRALRSGGQTGA